jgi:hypothetical protein
MARDGVSSYYAFKALLSKHGVRIEFAAKQIGASPDRDPTNADIKWTNLSRRQIACRLK